MFKKYENNYKSTIEEYCSLATKDYSKQKSQVFRFDNYMTILNELYPNVFNKKNICYS